MKSEFKHYENVTICTIQNDNGLIFYGEARCHTLDEDKYSERTGEIIAEQRAIINSLRYCRESIKEIIAQEQHLLNIMEQSKTFGHKDKNYRALKRQWYDHKEQLQYIKDEIASAQNSLKYYIGHK